MKVKDLIEILSKHDQEIEVISEDADGYSRELDECYTVKADGYRYSHKLQGKTILVIS